MTHWRLWGTACALAVALVTAASTASARPSGGLSPRQAPAALDSRLGAVAQATAAGGRLEGARLARRSALASDAAGLQVVVETDGDPDAVAARVRSLGGVVEARAAGLVQARVPPGRLVELARTDGVATVRPPLTPAPAAVAGEGVAAVNAPRWHAAGLRGAGVKVGVIDVGFGHYRDAQASGDLPAALTTANFCGGGFETDRHGTAVAEIVRDVAPDATLYLICVGTDVELAQAVAYAKREGIAIVNHSVLWYNAGRGDSSGEPGSVYATVADARASGILWVNAAGNDARRHWGGAFSDANGDGWHEFAGSDADNAALVSADSTFCAYLKWDDWPRSAVDYDLVLLHPTTRAVVGQSTNVQDGTQAPREMVCLAPGSVGEDRVLVTIRKVRGSTSPRLDLFTFGRLEHQIADHSIVDPAPSASSFSVGAVCWQTRELEPYSSRGPTLDGRVKPDLVGPDAVSSFILGAFAACGNTSGVGFSGTSASAPHVAGAAALAKQRYPVYGAAGLEQVLRVQSVDVGPAGPDTSFGAGDLRLIAEAPRAVTGGAPAIGARSVRVGGTLNPRGGAVYWFEYGPTAAYGLRAAERTGGEGFADVEVSDTLTGLAPNTGYHFRLVARGLFGTSTGSDGTFQTGVGAPPQSQTDAAGSVAESSAVLTGTISGEPASAHFDYGPTAAYGLTAPVAPLSPGPGEQTVTAALSGLTSGTTYHYRLVASNGFGTGLGADRVFTTAAPAPGGGGGAVDLGVSAEISPARLRVGERLRLVVHVRNKNAGFARRVVVTISVPAGATVVATRTERGAGVCEQSAVRSLRCDLDFIPAGVASTDVLVDANATAAGELTFRAAVAHDAADLSPADDAALATATATATAQTAAQTRTGLTRRGTPRADRLVGTPWRDTLSGLAGNDVLHGRGGADRLDGGPGKDRLDGGSGRDVLLGGAGVDAVAAADGARDVVRCGPGRDSVRADPVDAVARDCERVTRVARRPAAARSGR